MRRGSWLRAGTRQGVGRRAGADGKDPPAAWETWLQTPEHLRAAQHRRRVWLRRKRRRTEEPLDESERGE